MKTSSNFKMTVGVLSLLSMAAGSGLTSIPQAKADVLSVLSAVVIVIASTVLAATQEKENDQALLHDDAAAFLAADAQNPSAMLRVVFDKTREELKNRGFDAQLSDQEIAEIILRGN